MLAQTLIDKAARFGVSFAIENGSLIIRGRQIPVNLFGAIQDRRHEIAEALLNPTLSEDLSIYLDPDFRIATPDTPFDEPGRFRLLRAQDRVRPEHRLMIENLAREYTKWLKEGL